MTVRLQITKKQICEIFLCIVCTSGTLYFLSFFFFFQGLKPDSNDKVHLGYFTYLQASYKTYIILHKYCSIFVRGGGVRGVW
jgi:hypothetical protein